MKLQSLRTSALLFLTVNAALTFLAFGCSARKSKPTQLRVHPTNWLTDHPNFIFANNLQPEYGLACKSCHGEDFAGGTSGVSCVGCHNQRRDSTLRLIVCTGCHGGGVNPIDSTLDSTGAPPYSLAHDSLFSDRGVGGHPAMVNGKQFFSGTDCQTCHIKLPFVLTSTHFNPGEYGLGGVKPNARAEVVFSGLARIFATRYGAPVFDAGNNTCANVYCHGAFPGGDTVRVMGFYGGRDSVYCGSCHATTAVNDLNRLSGRHKTHDSLAIPCITCHYATVDSSNAIEPAFRRLQHVNGIFDVEFDPTTAPLGLFDGTSCSGLPDSPGCHANRRDW